MMSLPRLCRLHPATTARYVSMNLSSFSRVQQPVTNTPFRSFKASHLSRHLPFRAFHGSPRRPLRSNYTRFQQGSSILYRLSRDPNFLYYCAGGGAVIGGIYIFNLETVPVSGRRRFNVVSPSTEEWLSASAADQVRQEYGRQILPAWDPRVKMVHKVLDRLIPQSGLDGQQWEVTVIDKDEPNAFVIPGGKVFVFTGILPICGGEDGLATVLGHEIAHNVAHHAAERMSQAGVLLILQVLLFFFLGIGDEGRLFLDLVLSRPGSRAQESEADYLGLLMMARSCYNPEAAVGLWQRMEAAEKVKTPQFLSTHPSSHNRMEKMEEWMGKAEEQRSESGCGMLQAHSDQFRRAIRQEVW